MIKVNAHILNYLSSYANINVIATLEGGFEYSYIFQNGWEFSLIQKNNVNFIHGDTFRNGLLIGLKIPF